MSAVGPARGAETSSGSYKAPKVTVLGHVAELTQLGSGQMSELEMDGSQA